MVPKRRSFTSGGKKTTINRNMGRGSRPSNSTRPNKPRGRVFRRPFRDDDRKESFDKSSRRGSDSYGSRGSNNKRPRLGPKPQRGPWGGQSRKSYEEHEKKYWREPPKKVKKEKPARGREHSKDDFGSDSEDDIDRNYSDKEFGKDSENEFGGGSDEGFRGGDERGSKRNKKKSLKGGKKKKGRRGDSSPDPTQSELEAAYASFEENEDLLYERTRLANSKRLSDEQRAKTPRLPKSEDESHYKSKSKPKVSEKEWTDFLEKEIYNIEQENKTKKTEEAIGLKDNISSNTEQEEDDEEEEDQNDKKVEQHLNISLESETKAKQDEEMEHIDYDKFVRKRLVTLDNQWKWFHNLVKESSDGSIMVPKELPAEEDEEPDVEIKYDTDTSDEDEVIQSPLSSFDVKTEHKLSIEPPLSQLSETKTTTLNSQISEVGTKPPSSQKPEITTDVSSQPLEVTPSSEPLDKIQHEQPTESTTQFDISKDISEDEASEDETSEDEASETSEQPETNEKLQEDWRTFVSVLEQCTGETFDLPEELPDEQDEVDDHVLEYESEEPLSQVEPIKPCEELIESPVEPLLSQVEPIKPCEELIESPMEPFQKEEATSEQDEFLGDTSFDDYMTRKEEEKDAATNEFMYEQFKIDSTAEEFREEHPELFNPEIVEQPDRRVPLQWHHLKELWNRFIKVAIADPSKAFEEYDKIAEAKEKALKEGVDVAELLNLTSVPDPNEEPKTEYERTERKLRSQWRKYVATASQHPQEGLFKTLKEESGEDYKSGDEFSPELEKTYRTVLKLCDHPERFDMEKYEASLSKEEIDSLVTGDGMKYDRRLNPNAENEIKNKSLLSKRTMMAHKMWDYFVNLMRQRHETELEKFLAEQPQSVIVGDSPEDIKDLWQKYINHTNKAQELATGRVLNEGMDALWASEKRTRRPPPLEDEGAPPPNANSTSGWSKLQERVSALRSPMASPTEITQKSGTLRDRMRNISTFEEKPPPPPPPPPVTEKAKTPRVTFSDFAHRNRLDYYYMKEFPEENHFNQNNQREPYYKSYPQQEISNPRRQFDYDNNYRTSSYDRKSYQRNAGDYRNEQIQQIKGSESWQYDPEVSQMSSTPFGPNRQNTNYDRNQMYRAHNSRQSRWLMSREMEGKPLDPSQGYNKRGPSAQTNQRPLQTEDYNAPIGQGPHSNYTRQGAQYYPEQANRNWRQTQQDFLEEQNQPSSINQWRAGARQHQQSQNQPWATERPTPMNYDSFGAEYNQPGEYYGVGTQGKDCIHLTDPNKAHHASQQRQFEGQPVNNGQQTPSNFPPQRVNDMEPFDSNTTN